MSHNPYSPPRAEVADAQVSALDDVEGRRDVYRACILLWINFAMAVVSTLIDVIRNFGTTGTSEYVGMLIGLSIAFLINWWFVTKLKLGRNWMRILITVLTILGICAILAMWNAISKVMMPLYSQNPLDAILSLVQCVTSLVALWLLYTRRSRDWFTAVNS